MKRSFVLLITLSIIAASVVQAQEEPIPPKRSRGAKVGALGGVTMAWLFNDPAPINKFLQAGNASAVSDGGMFLYGGAGSAYIMLVKNLRVGGIGMSGSSKSSTLDPATSVRREAEVSAGYGALTFEYVLPIVERLDLVGGLALGWGGIDIELRKSTNNTTTWEQEQAALGSGTIGATNNLSRKFSGNFFIWTPSVSVEYAFLGWLGVRVGVSYLGMSNPWWEVDESFGLANVPSSVTGKGWMINGGVFLGTF